jgi:hypothetical protein
LTTARLRPVVRAVAVATIASLAAFVAASQPPTPPTRLLFIGNSLTSANDLPAVVQRLGRLNGIPIATSAVARPDFSLEDHWMNGAARRRIRDGGWSVVVLQQGPSALPESRVALRQFTRRFAEEARTIGAQPALYMVWPAKVRLGDFERVSGSYRLAAEDVGGLLLPAGDAWREAWARDPALPLYAADDFHPSALGSYLAALVIVKAITGGRVTTHADVNGRPLDAARLEVLDAAVRAATASPRPSRAPAVRHLPVAPVPALR